MMPTTPFCLGFGSNLGDRAKNLSQAIAILGHTPEIKVLRVSSFLETSPIGVLGHPMYLNAAVLFETTLTLKKVFTLCQDIETQLGRTSKGDLAPRTIDIDLLFFGDICVETPMLTLPHPRLHLRPFVLNSLLEVAPDWIHPILQKTPLALKQAIL